MQPSLTVVSNTSPIINLTAIGQLDLLRELYGTLTIPDAVYEEIVVHGHGQPGAAEVQQLSWFVRRSVSNRALSAQLMGSGLDVGEAEAIVLALETSARLLLMDEKLGRAAAARAGVRVIGLLGLLIEAKSRGLVPMIRPLLDALRTGPGFYIAPALYARVVQQAGE
jgi:uncharacterized protein